MSKWGIELLCGRISCKTFVTKIEEMNQKIESGKKVMFPYPKRLQAGSDFDMLVDLNMQTLMDRVKQLVKIGKQHRHFSPWYLEPSSSKSDGRDIPFMLSKKQIKNRFTYSKKTLNGSLWTKENLDGLSNHLTLENIEKFSVKTPLTKIPNALRDIEILDLINIFKARNDGESCQRAAMKASYETDRSLRVSNMMHTLCVIKFLI